MSQPPGTFQARQCAPDSHPDCRVFPSRSPRYTLPRPIAQDAGHRQLRIVVEDRLRYAAEEAECGVVPVAKRRIRLLRRRTEVDPLRQYEAGEEAECGVVPVAKRRIRL